MRVGDALEKICREQPGWYAPHLDRLIAQVGAIDQPSVQGHVAQMLQQLRGDLSDGQARRAKELLQRNLTRSTDWIVLNVTMDVLAEWAATIRYWLTGSSLSSSGSSPTHASRSPSVPRSASQSRRSERAWRCGSEPAG